MILAVCYLVFGGGLPFAGSPFTLKAVFTVQTELHLGSPVRIAGVNVGKVTSVQRVGGSSTAAVVTMSIQSNGLPIHADATADIRPRLFLEGNFYVDLHPGTPERPHGLLGRDAAGLADQRARCSSTACSPRCTPTRVPTCRPCCRASADRSTAGRPPRRTPPRIPASSGLTAGQALNQSLKYAADAFKASTIVNAGAARRSQPHDLSGVVAGSAHTFAALAAAQNHLADLVTTFNATMGALAARQQDLSTTIALLPPFAARRRQRARSAPGLVRADPAVRQALTPSVKQTAPTITAGLPWLAQSEALLSPQELGGLLNYLTPAVQGTSSTLISTKALLNGSDELAKCFVHTVIPTGNERISDPPLTTGLQVYQELFQSAVGLASIGQNFDGNGRYVRSAAGGGSDRVATGSLPGGGPLYGNAVLPLAGDAPRLPRQAAADRPQRAVLPRTRRPTSTPPRPGSGRETRDP